MRFRHGELHLVLLALLAERPMHGYELMGELARRVRRYRPSPGSIYPAISAMQNEGLISSDGGTDRRTYTLTPEGTAALARRSDRLAELEARLGVRLAGGADAVLARFVDRVRAVGKGLDEDELERVLDRTAAEIGELARGRRS